MVLDFKQRRKSEDITKSFLTSVLLDRVVCTAVCHLVQVLSWGDLSSVEGRELIVGECIWALPLNVWYLSQSLFHDKGQPLSYDFPHSASRDELREVVLSALSHKQLAINEKVAQDFTTLKSALLEQCHQLWTLPSCKHYDPLNFCIGENWLAKPVCFISGITFLAVS